MFFSSNSKGERIQVGAMTLSIRDVLWWLSHRGQIVASAETIDSRQFETIIAQLMGARILSISESQNDSNLLIDFENEWGLNVDLKNHLESDSDVIQVSLPDGRVLAVTEAGEIDENVRIDAERAQNWAKNFTRH